MLDFAPRLRPSSALRRPRTPPAGRQRNKRRHGNLLPRRERIQAKTDLLSTLPPANQTIAIDHHGLRPVDISNGVGIRIRTFIHRRAISLGFVAGQDWPRRGSFVFHRGWNRGRSLVCHTLRLRLAAGLIEETYLLLLSYRRDAVRAGLSSSDTGC